MNLSSLHLGMRVLHPIYKLGTVKAIDDVCAVVQFDDGVRRQVSPETSGLQPAEAQAAISGLEVPLAQFVADTVRAVVDNLGIERPESVREDLANRWHGGRVVLHPGDPTLQTKEVPLDVFFHKIVLMRNSLRTLEQRINASERLTEAEKFDWQGYVTRCYGSMTTFNVLFRRKEDQFGGTGA